MKSFTVPETKVFQAADGENLEILAWTVFAWSTSVTDGWTELRWLRRAESIAAFARKNNKYESLIEDRNKMWTFSKAVCSI